MSNENPTSSREEFDKNEESIAQKKQAINEAIAAGDYGKVAELAQEAKAMETAKSEMIGGAHSEALEENETRDAEKEMDNLHEQALEDNKAIDKANRKAALAEAAKLDAENSAKEAAAILEKLNGSVESSTEKVEIVPWEETEKATSEMSKMTMNESDSAKKGEEGVKAMRAFWEQKGRMAAEIARKAGYEDFNQLRKAKEQNKSGSEESVLDTLMTYTGLAESANGSSIYVDRFGNAVNKF